MTSDEEYFLKQKWVFQNIGRIFGNVMGNVGMKVLDFRKEGVLTIEDWKEQKRDFNYMLVDRTIDISFSANPKNVLRLRISELTSDKLIVTISGRKGDEKDDKFSEELVEFRYAPTLGDTADILQHGDKLTTD